MSSLATPRGGLRVVAATTALFTLALLLARLGDASGPDTLAYSASHLFGWRVVGVVLLMGCVAWIWLAAIEAVTRSRWAVRLGILALVVGAPFAHRAWAEAYWEARPWVSSHRINGGSPESLAGSTWRGTTGGECGYFSMYEITLDSDSTGSGHLLASYLGAPLMTEAVALGSYNSPRSRAVRVVARDDSVWLHLDGPPLIPRPLDGAEIPYGSEAFGPFALGR